MNGTCPGRGDKGITSEEKNVDKVAETGKYNRRMLKREAGVQVRKWKTKLESQVRIRVEEVQNLKAFAWGFSPAHHSSVSLGVTVLSDTAK